MRTHEIANRLLLQPDLDGCEVIQTSELKKLRLDLASAQAELKEARELLDEVYSGTVNQTTYPDGPCLDVDLRKRIKAKIDAAKGTS